MARRLIFLTSGVALSGLALFDSLKADVLGPASGGALAVGLGLTWMCVREKAVPRRAAILGGGLVLGLIAWAAMRDSWASGGSPHPLLALAAALGAVVFIVGLRGDVVR